MNHERFTECCFLRSIGRPLLAEFFTRFETELAFKGLVVPSAEASDDAFYWHLGRFLFSPEGLPDRLNEVLYEIQELSKPSGHEQLKAAMEQTGLNLSFDADGDTTPEEIALRVWLHSPELLARHYSENRFSRLKAFVHFERDTDCLALESSQERAEDSVLVNRLDAWFSANGRGNDTVLVDKFELNGEEWYVIRHGDRYLRSARIEKRKVEVVHYRPAKDDLVVYCPKRDELRINAKTKGEQELYRAAFGQYLHGFENYFRATETYSLEPLRTLGVEALACGDIQGMRKVVLTRLVTVFGDEKELTTVWEGTNLFECVGSEAGHLPLPLNRKLIEAVFRIYLTGSKRSFNVKICPPNVIRVENKQCAAGIVQDWLVARGFKRANPASVAAVA